MELKKFSLKQMQVLNWWMRETGKNYDAIICDGSIRSGKTFCMALSFILWSFYKFNGEAFGICGKTICSLRRNLIISLLSVLRSLGFLCKEKLNQNFIQISTGSRENIFYLFGGKDESSASFIQGITLAGVLFDETTLMPKSFVEQALARCSVPGSKFWFNCNPESPLHWFYREWILKKESLKVFYLRFTLNDNPSLNSEIIRRYERLYSGVFYQRFVLGLWVANQGLVYPFMNGDKAFCKAPPEENFVQYMLSCDYGIVNPFSCGLWAKSRDIWYRIDEYYYDSKTQGSVRTDDEHCSAIENLVNGRDVDCIIIDPSAASFVALLNQKGKFRVVPAKNKISSGIAATVSGLKNGKFKICENCKNSVIEFSLYRWNEHYEGIFPVKENDHAMDDIRYFISTVNLCE
ncbi:MAG: PBSX family phage terminase large subunit [Oscillospiraceae bacterium]|jgi:PBSX family phage terminase large subunit|nr:PBSX family phage terminase large subunit [Oscillospiraceae bacterium]